MKHLTTEISFEGKEGTWKVTYRDAPDWGISAQILLNGEEFHHFPHLPGTKTNNPTKTQAKELIVLAKKERLVKN